MKLLKRVDKEKRVDAYIVYIDHDEATEAFKIMTSLEKGMIADLQYSEQISTILKVLTIWVQRIEEITGPQSRRHEKEGNITYEG